jgi:FKBP-type peptidyl-prolyl cis-trans isomerase 2
MVMALIEPGMRVRHPTEPDWGLGQVQSVVGNRITVNFEHAGKVLINASLIALIIEAPPTR